MTAHPVLYVVIRDGDCTILLTTPIPCLSVQYYDIRSVAVAPYDYNNGGNATHPNNPPLLHAVVEQYDKWNFDASAHEIYLSSGTHKSEL